MLLINCPYCEQERAEIEFVCVGEARLARPGQATGQEWVDFLYHRTSPRGVHLERWVHVHGCGRYFNAARDTLSDRFIATCKPGQPFPETVEKETGRP